MKRPSITLTFEDYSRLRDLLASKATTALSDSAGLRDLHAELDRATVVDSAEIPRDVVTMNSTITLRDIRTRESETYTLVYPTQADIANHRLSVLAPVGTAILGHRVGDEFKWPVPSGWRRLKIEQVVYQPERENAVR
jgi:regulator of nucleoside diphosphate kinase